MDSHDLTESENNIIFDLLVSTNYQQYLNVNEQALEQVIPDESNNFSIRENDVQYDSTDTGNHLLQRLIEQQVQIKQNENLLQQQYLLSQQQNIQKNFISPIGASHLYEQSKKNNEVMMYKDSNLTIPVDDQHIIKEKVYYFLLSNVFSSFNESDVQSNQILQIHSDVFQYDKRRSSFSKEIIGYINAKAVDEDGEEQTTCENCSKQSGNGNNIIIQVKYASRSDNNAHVIASLFCSGNPSSSKRRLKVIFTVTSNKFPNWEGSTKLFSVYHHKPPQKKLKSQSKDTHPQSHPYSKSQSIVKKDPDHHILKQHKILKRTFKVPTEDACFSSVFGELYSHLVELCDADTSNFYNSTFIHSAIVMSYYISVGCNWEKEDVNKLAKSVVETSVSGLGIVAFCYQDRNEHTIEKICKLIVKNSQVGDTKDPLWVKMYADMHTYHQQSGKGLGV